jgi:hypothetical protein
MAIRFLRTCAVAAFAAALATPVLAEDAGSGTGSDSGDNGMTPMYGDSWGQLQGHVVPAVPNMQIYETAPNRGQVRSRVQRYDQNAYPPSPATPAPPTTRYDPNTPSYRGAPLQYPSPDPGAPMSTSPYGEHD